MYPKIDLVHLKYLIIILLPKLNLNNDKLEEKSITISSTTKGESLSSDNNISLLSNKIINNDNINDDNLNHQISNESQSNHY